MLIRIIIIIIRSPFHCLWDSSICSQSRKQKWINKFEDKLFQLLLPNINCMIVLSTQALIFNNQTLTWSWWWNCMRDLNCALSQSERELNLSLCSWRLRERDPNSVTIPCEHGLGQKRGFTIDGGHVLGLVNCQIILQWIGIGSVFKARGWICMLGTWGTWGTCIKVEFWKVGIERSIVLCFGIVDF